ncbi:23S rRNA (uracil(1939)-C(5))-methyltransferase RlmD [Saezia sanguinis]|uniref:23S rRNA (uracil(1939)-C(5))-methyltransferase RlmD n=1 Tax=Saezia sanguinis TaxID=1965230 RepID=A0A433SDD9_9BURK|nr:23S rRNA (uracil(1939)-C(5))-methyltransferase RlmD [Saezia sanguinis]RUS66762.1 23S rRNA (uracil(1939)-C(5))-methyltransferase RlmD [Saezia sanguinis]
MTMTVQNHDEKTSLPGNTTDAPAPVSTDARTLSDEWLQVESLDLEAQGIAHNHAGKVLFIEGALPGESVQVDVRRRKNQWEAATARVIRRESALRVKPRCPYYGVCGGCAMQHFHPVGQIAVKQRVLEDNLWHLGKVKPDMVLRPIEGPAWGYRWRARLSVRHVYKKNTVLIGFREKRSTYVADMQTCEILPPDVSALLMPLRDLIISMDGCDRIPQIELAVGTSVIALVVRHLEPLTAEDAQRLRQFADGHSHGRKIQWWLQPKGPDTVHLLDQPDTASEQLSYALPEFRVTMPFKPTDFTQVNPFINQVLVSRAVRALDIQPHERVIDWFCGLGNFTLPMATQAREVLGIEGSEILVARAQENALFNQRENTRFAACNLFEVEVQNLLQYGVVEKWLVDPPREGALALAKALAQLHQEKQEGKHSDFMLPQRIVYVSCNPATLARDAGLLVHQAGYCCSAAGVINMFPHTAHVESMAVFDYLG